MNGLKQVALIKSAKFDFARVNVDGNSLFIGANGAGKTTLLRAILYFYTASSNGLGISSNKKISFSEYYFEYENSYIVYIYKKDEKYVLVTVYKDSSVKFRFTLFDTMPDIKQIFIENDKPLELGNLWLKLKALGNCSNIVQNGAKYKEILYSKTPKYKEFSLFEAKEYETFTKTLSNIFINSKVDSTAIKKVIVSSLGIDSSIDLSQVQRHLSRFNEMYEDIKSYEINLNKIKNIIELLNEYEQTKGLLQDDMSTLLFSKKEVKNLIKTYSKELELLEKQNSSLEEKLQQEQNLFSKRKDRLNQIKGALNSFLKQIDKKEIYYEKEQIEKKLKEYDTKDAKEEQEKLIKTKIEFLTKEFTNIKNEHELQIQAIKNSFIASKNSIDTKIFELKSTQNSLIQVHEKEQNKELEKISELFLEKSMEQKDEEQELISSIQRLNYEQKNLQALSFEFKEQKKLVAYENRNNSIKNEIDNNKAQLIFLDSKLTNKKQLHENEFKSLNLEFENNQKELSKEIENIQALLVPNKNSLIDKLYKNSKNTNRYLYFLKDEILKSDIEIEFKEDSNTIFEIKPEEEIAQNSLEKKQESFKTKLHETQKTYEKNLEKLNKEFKNYENRIYREKRALNDKIKELEIELLTTNSKYENLKNKKISEEKNFTKEKASKEQELKNSIKEQRRKEKELNEKKSNLAKEKQNAQKSKKLYFTKQINKIKDEYDIKTKEQEEYLSKLQEKKLQEEKNQEELYHKLLKEKNVDTKELKKYEQELQSINLEIRQLEKYQNIIIEYKKDKQEYIDKKQEKQKELKDIQKQLEVLITKYEEDTKQLKQEQNIIIESLKQKQKNIRDLEYQIIRCEEFENSATFNDCINWGIKYIDKQSAQSSEDISMLTQKIDNLVSKYKKYYERVQKLLARVGSIFDNSLNITKKLDALDTAYDLKDYFETNKIENAKGLLSQNLNQILKSIVEQYDKLLESQGKIQTLISKITKIFQEIKIGVIDTLALRYQKTNNKIIETFLAIKEQNEQNALSFSSDSLFASSSNNSSKEIIELLKKLVDLIEYESTSQIDIEDSFILEFRVVENGNDSKYVQSLDMVGSNGTDVLVKSMIYVAMLHIFKEKLTKKELSFQVVLDEVGILSQRYLKELIEFANKKAIMFVNGAPDEKLIGTYKQVSLISKINKISVVKELIVK